MAIIESTHNKENLVGNKNEHNTFIFREGCGHDTIKSYKGEGDIIRFDGLQGLYDIYFEKKGNNLKINYGNNNSVTIVNYLKNPEKSPIKYIEMINNQCGDPDIRMVNLAENVVIDFEGRIDKKNTLVGTALQDDMYGGDFNDVLKGNGGDDELEGGRGDDKLYGGAGENYLYFSEGDGNDVVYSDPNGEDFLFIEGSSISNMHLEKGKYNGIKIVTEHGDSIELANYLKTGFTSVKKIQTDMDIETPEVSFRDFIRGKNIYQYGDYKNNKLTGTDLNDELYGYDGKDTLNGKKGNDILKGGAGIDTIKGGDGSDKIYGGTGNDKLYGELGNNNFYFSNGDGQDTIYLGKGVDTINFDNSVSIESLKYAKKGANLIITYGDKNPDGTDNTITISNYFKAKDLRTNSVNTIKINGETLKLSNIVIQGSDGFWQDDWSGDYYYSKDYLGTSKSDFIYTNNNKVINYIEAGAGNDSMQIESKFTDAHGGSGNDTYTIKSLKNTTYITDESGNDTVILSEKSRDVKIIFDVIREGKTPQLGYDTEEYGGLLVLNKAAYNKILKTGDFHLSNGIYIDDYFNSNTIEKFQTKDGVITSAEIERARQNIVSWLEHHDYNSALDALYLSENPAEINGLINLYNTIS